MCTGTDALFTVIIVLCETGLINFFSSHFMNSQEVTHIFILHVVERKRSWLRNYSWHFYCIHSKFFIHYLIIHARGVTFSWQFFFLLLCWFMYLHTCAKRTSLQSASALHNLNKFETAERNANRQKCSTLILYRDLMDLMINFRLITCHVL